MFLLRVLCVVVACACAGGSRYHPETDDELGPFSARNRDPAELTADFWIQEAQNAIKKRASRSGAGSGRARNVILFLGDGMSMPTVAAARALLGQRDGRPGEEAELSFEAFPTVGFSKTYCVNAQVADSACSANAYLTGVKNNQGMLGLTAGVARRDCAAAQDPRHHVDSIAAWALADGRDVGIVTTTRVTHASPAGAYARAANRGWETDQLVAADGRDPELCRDIAQQLVHSYPGNQFKVILGGGRRNFISNETRDEEGTRGRRTDGRDLIQEWQDDKRSRNVTFAYAWNRDQLMSVYDDPPEYLMGLFEGNHMQYHLEANETTEPTLREMTEIAIRSLSRNEKGYFLFVEGGRIDHAHHSNLVHLALDETIELHAAVAGALRRVSAADTLVVVTADHAHVMAYSGYAARGRNVLAPSAARDLRAVPYMTLSYINGPGARAQLDGVRVDVTTDSNFGKTRWASHADVPLESETHGGDDVGVYAWGPHHELFAGVYEQSQLPHLMAYAGCFGRGLTACEARADAATALANAGFTLITVLIGAVNRRLY